MFDADPDPDPGSELEKMDPNPNRYPDPDPCHFFQITDFFLTYNNFKICCLIFFSRFFILKLDEPFRNEESFIISLFPKVKIWSLGVNKFLCCSFWLIFTP